MVANAAECAEATTGATTCSLSDPYTAPICFLPGSASTLLVKKWRVAINSSDVDSGTSATGTNTSCRTDSDCGGNTCNGYIPATGSIWPIWPAWIYYEWNDIRVTDGTTTYTLANKNVWASIAGTGIASYGYYFQRGNNYGFPNTGTVSPAAQWAVDTSAYNPTNPYNNNTFRWDSNLFSTTNGDWSSNLNDNLRWHTTNTDIARKWPCPTWYHIPTYAEWKWLVNTRASLTGKTTSTRDGSANFNNDIFSSDLKLPRAGYRRGVSDSWYPNNDGHYWSSTPFSTSAYLLDFLSVGVSANDGDDRAVGHSVRCFKNLSNTTETLWTCSTTDPVLIVNWTGGVRASIQMLDFSDIRIKTNIQKINNALADITRLKGYQFTWIDSGKPDFGVLAQEIEKVFASMVSEDSKGIKAVNYTELLAPIIEAIHEINTRVDELTRETQAQALRIETLEK